jgi:hypothetical protein
MLCRVCSENHKELINIFCGQNEYVHDFNVFPVRALYYTKTLITTKCTKRVLSSIVTHSYMFRPCWVIFRENFFVIVTLRLHFIAEWEMCCWLCTALFLVQCKPGPQRVHVSSTQSTAHSHSNIKCNLSVTVTKKFSLKIIQQGRNM